MTQKIKYGNNSALTEYMIEGNRISVLEAVLYFGISNPYETVRGLKKKGFIINRTEVTMAKILRRINENLDCKTPKNLPIRDIIMSEWWISK